MQLRTKDTDEFGHLAIFLGLFGGYFSLVGRHDPWARRVRCLGLLLDQWLFNDACG
jgi:hypothetical protein